VATRGLGIYNTSKYAVVGLSETLVKDLKPYNIGVSVLCPMGVSTNIRASERNRPAHLKNDQPSEAEPVELMGRYLAPDTVAEMVLGAIRRSELYVITHDEGLEPLRSRFERMERTIRQRKPCPLSPLPGCSLPPPSPGRRGGRPPRWRWPWTRRTPASTTTRTRSR